MNDLESFCPSPGDHFGARIDSPRDDAVVSQNFKELAAPRPQVDDGGPARESFCVLKLPGADLLLGPSESVLKREVVEVEGGGP